MKVSYNNEYYKIANSEIPKTYQNLLEILPEIVFPESLPSEYRLHYRDFENFPIKLSNQRAYKGLLEETKKSHSEIVIVVLTEQEEQQFRNMNLAFDGQPNHVLSLSKMNRADPGQLQSLTQNSSGLEVVKKEEANSMIIEEGIVAYKSEYLEGESNERPLQDPIKYEDVGFETSEFDVLKEGLSDRLEKMQKKENQQPEKRGRQLKDLKEDNKEPKSAENGLKKGSKRNDKEIVKKKRRALETKNERETEAGAKARAQLSKLMEEYIKNMAQLQKKWKDHFVVEVDFEAHTLKVMAVFNDSLEGVDFKVNNTITDKKVRIFMKELVEVFKNRTESIKTLAIYLKNCYSLSKIGLNYIIDQIEQDFYSVPTLDLDFSYDQLRLVLKKKKKIQREISFNFPLDHLKQLTLNLRFRSDIQEFEIRNLQEDVFNWGMHLEIPKIIQPLRSYKRTYSYYLSTPPEEPKREYWDINKILPRAFYYPPKIARDDVKKEM